MIDESLFENPTCYIMSPQARRRLQRTMTVTELRDLSKELARELRYQTEQDFPVSAEATIFNVLLWEG